MPVIRNLPTAITDIVVQGEAMRAYAMNLGVMEAPLAMIPLVEGMQDAINVPMAALVEGDQSYGCSFVGDGVMMPTVEVLRDGDSLARNNAMISTPCGALVQIPLGLHILNAGIIRSTELFYITGQTKAGNGSALGSCRVVVQETGRIAVDGHAQSPLVAAGAVGSVVPPNWATQSPVVAEAISDGSGNFSINVPLNTAYQLDGYKAGSPDVAGVTRNDVKPTDASTSIYLRDPTAADSAGAGSGMSRGRVTNA